MSDGLHIRHIKNNFTNNYWQINDTQDYIYYLIYFVLIIEVSTFLK